MTSLLIGSSSILQVTRTAIKSQMGLNPGQIRPFTSELLALECRKKPIFDLFRSIVPSVLILVICKIDEDWIKSDPIFVNLTKTGSKVIQSSSILRITRTADNQDSHKISAEFNFQPHQTIHVKSCLPVSAEKARI